MGIGFCFYIESLFLEFFRCFWISLVKKSGIYRSLHRSSLFLFIYFTAGMNFSWWTLGKEK